MYLLGTGMDEVGTFVVFFILAVFCLMVWVVMWMYFYYSLQPYTYFRYLYISQLKRKQKMCKALNCYRLFSHTVLCKDQLMVCWKPFSFPPNSVKISFFFVLYGGFGIDCSSAVNIMQGWSGSVGGGKKLQGSPKDRFSNGSGAWLWFYTSHGTITFTIFHLLKSIR